jgi:hypothetical protein
MSSEYSGYTVKRLFLSTVTLSELFLGDGSSNIFSLDLRNGRVAYAYKGKEALYYLCK